VSEIVHDGVNGRLLAAEDVPALTAALVDVLRDPPTLDRMRRAIPAALRSFTAPVVSARWNALFTALTEA
jgi:glycosyltransferase involved in cell wall biosynthesis